jgi:hypothetical protein
MQGSVDQHRRDRPDSWATVEEPEDVASVVYTVPGDRRLRHRLDLQRSLEAPRRQRSDQERVVLPAAQELADAGL